SDAFASLTSSVAAVTINGAAADSFSPAAASIIAMAIQGDGKILLGASASGLSANKIVGSPVRLNPDGTTDSTFVPGITNSTINCLAVQADGKILAGGIASTGQRTTFLWRMNSDGTIDANFTNNLGSGPSGTVYCLALQADGKILFGGSFST